MIEGFNRAVDYIESALKEDVDESEIFRLTGYSYSMFSRLFSILTEMTLAEYVRYRKLSEAAIQLRETDNKIIDIAFDYGYESSDSFGLAFKSFHGCTPSDVRKGKQFRVVSRVQLALSIRGGRTMNITIQKKPAFIVAGVKADNIESSLCPEVWDKLYDKYTHEQLAKLGSGQSYGMCYDTENCNKINYMACYDVDNSTTARNAGLEVVEITEAEYAVAELRGSVPDCIHAGWKYLMEVFFPEQGYRHTGAPDFEVYGEGDMDSDTYEMQLWVPVEREQ